jgi:hypothetical protein
LLLEIEPKDGSLEGRVSKAQQALGPRPTLKSANREGDAIHLVFENAAGETTFDGLVGKDGSILGTFRLRDRNYASRLTTAAADATLEAGQDRALIQRAMPALQTRDAAKKAELLREIATEVENKSSSPFILEQLFGAEIAASVDVPTLKATIEKMDKAAAPYGPIWVAEVKGRVLQNLSGKTAYAELALPLAEEAEKQLGESAPLEQRAKIASALAMAAEAMGKTEIATAARKKSDMIEAKLDEEYHAKVPPFKPEPVARTEAESERVVLMELFTGAQCPPCVAADVGFDALIESYKPTELITLQYHLHIPGPDPLTNADAIKRQEYYEVNSTPTTLFNGVPKASGGGGMANAKAKYDAYLKVVSPLLAGKKQAEIDLTADRQGETIAIQSSAKAIDPPDEAKLRLRLVVVEDIVKYVGGNNLRFHHHVVRAMPGGPEGIEMAEGKGQAELSITLSDIRGAISKYLDEFTSKGQAFPYALPPVKLDKLAVVAFVQNDTDKSVLHAVSVPLEAATAAASNE